MEEEKSKVLEIGSFVSFSSVQNPESFIYTDGFVKDRITLRNFARPDAKNVFSKCLFQIYPFFTNTHKKEAQNLLDESKSHHHGEDKPQGKVGTKSQKEIHELQEKLMIEFRFNQEAFKKVTNNPVSFGQPIQLLHISSNKFLALRPVEADMERENYKLFLEDITSDYTVFKFMPCYRHQKDSEGLIFINDHIYLTSAILILNRVPYVHFTEISRPAGGQEELKSIEPEIKTAKSVGKSLSNAVYRGTGSQTTASKSYVETKKLQKYKIEVNGSIETPVKLMLNQFSQYIPDENNFLCYGDTVWLNHSEYRASLVVTKQLDSKSSTSSMKVDFDNTVKSDNFKQFVGNTNGMWIIESENYQKGGFLPWNTPARFRHFSSGQYLCVKSVTKDDKSKSKDLRISLSPEPDQDCLFELNYIESTLPKGEPRAQQYVLKDSFAMFQHCESKSILHLTIGKQGSSSSFWKPTLSKRWTEEDAFRVIKANFNEVWETNFLISCFPKLRDFLDDLIESNLKPTPDPALIAKISRKMKTVKVCIRDLGLFVTNKLFNTSPDQKYGETNRFRQKLLQEQYFLDLFVLILKEALPKAHLDLYERYINSDEFKKKHDKEAIQAQILIELAKKALNQNSLDDNQLMSNRREAEMHRFIEKKVQLCINIYSLLTQICKSNAENEVYVYGKCHLFLLHCKYLREAVNFLISIVSTNSKILQDLGENLKTDIDFLTTNQKLMESQNIINIVINIRDSTHSLRNAAKDIESSQKHNNRISRPTNLINFFINLIREQSSLREKTINYLRFLRAICAADDRAMSTNQEILYKLMQNNKNYIDICFIKLLEDKGKLKLINSSPKYLSEGEGDVEYLEDIYLGGGKKIDKYTIQYLEEQLKFFSDLSLDRNYLWKTFLEKILPSNYLFTAIWNQDLPKDIRSAMCMLALTVYIDHEPFNILNVPAMCRTYEYRFSTASNTKHRTWLMDGTTVVDQGELINVELLGGLVKHLIEYLKAQVETLEKSYIQQFESRGRKVSPDQANSTKDLLNDPFLLNVMKLLSKLIKFDIFKTLEKKELYGSVVNIFFRLLEHDHEHEEHCYLLSYSRNENLRARKAEEANKTNIFKGIGKQLKGAVGSVVSNVTQIGSMFGIGESSLSHQSKKGDLKEQLDDKVMFNNPIMRSMLALTNSMQRLQFDSDGLESQNDIKIKIEICDVLEFILDLRKDFLISNFVAWYDKLGIKLKKKINAKSLLNPLNKINWKKSKKVLDQKQLEKAEGANIQAKTIEILNDLIASKVSTIMPNIARLGVLDLDLKYGRSKSNILFNNKLINTFKTGDEKANQRQFKIYTLNKDDLIPNLDELFAGLGNTDEIEVLPSLLLTFITANSSVLEGRILDVAMRLYNQRQELLDALQDLELLFDEDQKKFYNRLKNSISSLKYLVEKSEVWLTKYTRELGDIDLDGSDDEEEKKESATKIKSKKDVPAEVPGEQEIQTVIRLIQKMNETLFEQDHSAGQSDKTPEEEKHHDKAQEEPAEISVSRQNIMRFLKGYAPIVSMIKDGIHHLSNAILDTKLPSKRKRLLVKLFRECHTCLSNFCYQNENNQVILAKYKELFLSYSGLEVGQFKLLSEIHRNNKKLCEEADKTFLQKFLDVIQTEGRQEKFLDIFEVIQMRNGFYNPEQQMLTLKMLIDYLDNDKEAQAKVLYTTITKSGEHRFQLDETLVSILEESFIGRLEKQQFQDTYRDEPFIYHAKLLEILLLIVKGDEFFSVAKAKMRNVFSLNYLLALVLESDNFTDGQSKLQEMQDVDLHKMNQETFEQRQAANKVVENLISLDVGPTGQFNANLTSPIKVHTEDKERKRGYSILKPKVVEFITQLYLQCDKKISDAFLQSVNHDSLMRIVEMERKRVKDIADGVKVDEKYYSYFFGSFLEFITAYISKFLNDPTLNETGHRADNTALFLLAEALSKNLHLFEKKLDETQYYNLKKLLNTYVSDFDQIRDKLVATLQPNSEEKNEPVNFRPLQLKKEESGKENDGTASPFKSLAETFLDSEEDEIKSEKWTTKQAWRQFLGMFSEAEDVKKSIELEKLALGDGIMNFEKMLNKDLKEKLKIEYESSDIIDKLVSFLRFGISRNSNKRTIIATIETLICMMKKENKAEKVEMQNLLDKHDATRMVLTVLSSSVSIDSEILLAYLNLLVALLEGGNNKVQKTIFNYFQTFSRSEVIFAKFHSIIASQTSKQNRASKEQILENLLESGASELVILEKTLRVLQLFTEGHYLDLQNYIRDQTNSRNNYDLVSAVVDLLRSYLNNLSQANYENIMGCLDTLAEFVQGPCPENQSTLIDGKFFEIANFILNYDGNKSRRSSSKRAYGTRRQSAKLTLRLDVTKWMIARLKYKTLVLTLSLLEARTGPQTVKRIMRALPIEILKKNLAKFFKKYKELYKNTYPLEAFGHFDLDASKYNSKADKKEKLKYEVIIESGFAIYFLLSSYYEITDIDDDKQVVEQYKQSMVENKKGSLTKNLLKDNVVGQLGNFALTFVKAGVSTASALTKKVGTDLFKLQTAEEQKEFEKKLELKLLAREALQFFAKNSAQIEVVRNEQLESLQFIVLPFCHDFPKERKVSFNENCNRTSVKSKVKDLATEIPIFIKVAKHEHSLKLFFGKQKLIAIFVNYVSLWRDIGFILTIVMNIFILGSYSVTTAEEESNASGDSEASSDSASRRRLQDDSSSISERISYPSLFGQFDTDRTLNLFYILGAIIVSCTACVVVFFLIKRAPLIIKRGWGSRQDFKNKGLVSKLFVLVGKVLKVLLEMLKEPEVIYYIAYGFFAFLGLILHPFFYAFGLSEVILRYPTLKNVIKSFWKPKQALFLTLILFLIIEYLFMLIGFTFFNDYFAGNCQSTIDCFLWCIDWTFKADGGIGGQFESVYTFTPGEYTGGLFIYTNMFNLFLVIVITSIVAGIIIDTFGALREDEIEKNKDIQDFCFICGFDRETFDRRANDKKGFEGHIKMDHYMWNYVYYIAYLLQKEVTDYTGIESYIAQKYKENDFSWFPMHKAIALQHLAQEEEEQKNQIMTIQSQMLDSKKICETINTNFNIIQESLMSEQKLQRKVGERNKARRNPTMVNSDVSPMI